MQIKYKRLFNAVVFFIIILLVGCDSSGAFSDDDFNEVTLERIDIMASPITTKGTSILMLASGNKQPFEVRGYYSDGSVRKLEDLNINNWHTSDQSEGFFETPGILTAGNKHGLVTVFVSKDNIISNKVIVSISDAVIEKILVTPALVNLAQGQPEQLTVMAVYSDDTTADITDSVDWSIANTSIINITKTGVITGIEQGNTTLQAMLNGIVSNQVDINVSDAVLEEIVVTPASVNLARGQLQHLTATAVYSDDTTADMTENVAWLPYDMNDNSVANVNAIGVVKGLEQGKMKIKAVIGGISSKPVDINVSDAVLEKILVEPASVDLARGQLQHLTAMAVYSDDTTADMTENVVWRPYDINDDNNVASVNAIGVVKGLSQGNTTIKAVIGGMSSKPVEINVSDAVLEAIVVTPARVKLAKGQLQQLKAKMIYSDDTTSEVTENAAWFPYDINDDISVASVNAIGVVKGLKQGNTTIKAVIGGISSKPVDINVSDAVLEKILVEPASVDLAKGQLQHLTAMAVYSDDTTADMTENVVWRPYDINDDNNVASVNAIGVVKGLEQGNTTIKAAIGEISDLVEINVSDAVLEAIEVSPERVKLAKGQLQELKAKATYSDGTTADMTENVVWLPYDINDDNGVASANAIGVVKGLKQGNTTIKASIGEINDLVEINVSDAVPEKLEIRPSNLVLGVGQVKNLSAWMIYSDGEEIDVSTKAEWFLGSETYATMMSRGVIRGESIGETSLQAFFSGKASEKSTIKVEENKVTLEPTELYISEFSGEQMKATIIYPDNTQISGNEKCKWSKSGSNSENITIDKGFVTTTTDHGYTYISVDCDDTKSNTTLIKSTTYDITRTIGINSHNEVKIKAYMYPKVYFTFDPVKKRLVGVYDDISGTLLAGYNDIPNTERTATMSIREISGVVTGYQKTGPSSVVGFTWHDNNNIEYNAGYQSSNATVLSIEGPPLGLVLHFNSISDREHFIPGFTIAYLNEEE
ncbi:Ig-like domain-containing protein [Photobacterium leiognathi]|uniref:Ig-like domain-containing protein n=1 Tax=Photobacterium leiognathi TaxID=553611 RepID=UPI002982AC5A|nr:Ig-like domain-containing protein [Photobacterium leiognathi]